MKISFHFYFLRWKKKNFHYFLPASQHLKSFFFIHI